MESIYRKVLGSEFNKLHPEIQKRFGFSSKDGIAAIGKGAMERVWFNRLFTFPFLYIGTWRNILFPQSGTDIPFTIENYAYEDSFGRETVTWVRTYDFPGQKRRFDATMIYSEERNRIVDYLGTHQHLAVDIDISVAENGGLKLRSGDQRFYEKLIAFRFPLLFSGIADVCEWYDERENRFKIQVDVKNKRFGDIFAYKGTFEVEYLRSTPEKVPLHVRPVREEKRE